MSDDQRFQEELVNAMSDPIGEPRDYSRLSFPMSVQWVEPPIYTVTYLKGTVNYTTKVTGHPSFEDGDLVFHGNNGVVRAFGRGRWLDIEIIEDK